MAEKQERIRLIHVTTVPESLGFFAGQVGYMRDRGFEVHALSSPGDRLEEFGASEGVQVHAVEMPRRVTPLQDLVAVLRIARLFRRLRPQIVHAHTPKGGLLGMAGAWLARVPVRIYHVHGLPFLTARGVRRLLLQLSEVVACLVAHQVLSVSRSVRRVMVARRLCPAWKIKVLGKGSINGVEADRRFNPEVVGQQGRLAARARFAIPADAIVVGFVGRLVRDKGLIELAGAWKELREKFSDLHLLVIGPFEPQDPVPPGIVDALRRDPRVHLVGEDRNTPPLYGAMDIVVLPTHREGFPLVPLEAAAMALPVVATRVPGCVDAVRHRVTGLLVPAGDSRALAEAIDLYLRDEPLRRTHGAAGRRRVLRDFRQEAIWTAVHEEYMRLLQWKSVTHGAKGSMPWEGDTCESPTRGPAPLNSRIKRLIDVAGASVGLLLLSPVLVAIAAVIRLTMGSPVLFRQERPGLHVKPFALLKFRTMTDARDPSGALLPDTLRLTRLGRFLRSTSLDELPELVNVLKGDMSLVGPRPLLMRYVPYFSERERKRFLVRPGITGLAQVLGRNDLAWDARLAYDVMYVEKWSLTLDLKILVLTLWRTLTRHGLRVDPGAAMLDLDEERRQRLEGAS